MAALRMAAMLLIASTVAVGTVGSTGSNDGVAALEQGFRFASAIEQDENSKGQSQLVIVLTLAEIGKLDLAVSRAGSVVGWQQGVAYAELAGKLADAGRSSEAKRLLDQARTVRNRTQGWQGPRISAHIAQAMARLGDVDGSGKLSQSVVDGDVRQYLGQAAAAVASGHAVNGDFEEAMASLQPLEGNEELEVARWRARGYLMIAQFQTLSVAQRLEALDAAREALGVIPGPIKVDLLRTIAAEYLDLGKRKQAEATIKEARDAFEAVRPTDTKSPRVMASLARGWASLGDTKRAVDLLEEAEQLAIRASSVDRPGLMAEVAVGYSAAERTEDYERTLSLALDMTEKLANSRPRAVAVVQITRALGEARLPLDGTTVTRLDAIYTSLGDPW
jgi:tetratricopeptide (TPR) repeat protein